MSPNPSQGEVPEAVTRVLDCADRLDNAARIRVGLTQSMINEARLALISIRSQIDKEWEERLEEFADVRMLIEIETGQKDVKDFVDDDGEIYTKLSPREQALLASAASSAERLKEVERQRAETDCKLAEVRAEAESLEDQGAHASTEDTRETFLAILDDQHLFTSPQQEVDVKERLEDERAAREHLILNDKGIAGLLDPEDRTGVRREPHVPLSEVKEALRGEEAKAALYEATLRYQNVDPREQSVDGWAEALLIAVRDAAFPSDSEGQS